MPPKCSLALLEIGCGASGWLPYFSKEFGFKVSGVDYSPIGCELAKKMLKESGVDGQVVCCNLFDPPECMEETFDVVVSFGLIEHFEDTTSVVRAASKFLKPGGMLITNIPNMTGAIGYLQKALNKPVYDVHKLLDRNMLRYSHEYAGLEIIQCEYFLFSHFGVCALNGVGTVTPTGVLKKALVGGLSRMSMAIAKIEDEVGEFPARKFTSPYINCVARKR
jgi:2-polyprenyl-3-methyl-5-hydroxy-6-metoxy-1,4-benzoquinol methylase